MKMTVGPLPPAVYWRRRAAVGALLMAILLGFATCRSAGSDATPAASRSTPTPTGSAGPSAAPSTPAPGSPAPSSPAPARAATGSAPTSPVGPATQNAPATGGIPDCTDAALRVVASLDGSPVAYGSMPRLHLTVSNAGTVACRRDVGADAQELRVMDGTRRLWSSDDCQPLRGTSVRTLQPGEKRVYTVTWSGKDSTPGCRQARTRVAPGTYQLIARVDTVVSARTSFRIG
jgi:hypothetical protein